MKSAYQNLIIYRIRQLREEKGYSQDALARIIGISNGHMGNIESFRTSHKYTLAQIQLISKEFNIPIEQIFLEDEDYMRSIDIISLLIDKIVQYGNQ